MDHNQPDMQETEQDHGGDIALSTILMVGLAGTAILIVIIILVRGLFVNMVQQERYEKVIAQKPVQLMQLREQAQNRLNAYEWTDRENGYVSIPIDEAMTLAAAQLSTQQAEPVVSPAPVVEDTPVAEGSTVEAEEPEQAPRPEEGTESGSETAQK